MKLDELLGILAFASGIILLIYFQVFYNGVSCFSCCGC